MAPKNPRHVAVGIDALIDSAHIAIPSVPPAGVRLMDVWVDPDDVARALSIASRLGVEETTVRPSDANSKMAVRFRFEA